MHSHRWSAPIWIPIVRLAKFCCRSVDRDNIGICYDESMVFVLSMPVAIRLMTMFQQPHKMCCWTYLLCHWPSTHHIQTHQGVFSVRPSFNQLNFDDTHYAKLLWLETRIWTKWTSCECCCLFFVFCCSICVKMQSRNFYTCVRWHKILYSFRCIYECNFTE